MHSPGLVKSLWTTMLATAQFTCAKSGYEFQEQNGKKLYIAWINSNTYPAIRFMDITPDDVASELTVAFSPVQDFKSIVLAPIAFSSANPTGCLKATIAHEALHWANRYPPGDLFTRPGTIDFNPELGKYTLEDVLNGVISDRSEGSVRRTVEPAYKGCITCP